MWHVTCAGWRPGAGEDAGARPAGEAQDLRAADQLPDSAARPGAAARGAHAPPHQGHDEPLRQRRALRLDRKRSVPHWRCRIITQSVA